jgi:hypothetical protein
MSVLRLSVRARVSAAERARAVALANRMHVLQAELAAAQDQMEAPTARALAAGEAEQALRQAAAETTAELHRQVGAAQMAQAEAEADA